MNTQEFANSIRQKYPDAIANDGRKYSDIPDSELVSKIVEKYPVYKSQITDLNQTLEKQNMPSSSMDFVKGVFGGAPSETNVEVAKGVGKSYLAPLQTIGNAILNPIKNVLGLTDVKTGLEQSTITPQNKAQEIGKVAGDISQFFIPASSINKAREAVQLYKGAELANALSKIGITNPKIVNTIVNGGKLALESLIEGGSSAGITAAQTGEFGTEAKTSGLIGASMPVIGKTVNLLKKSEAPILSFTSGVPQKAIEEVQNARPAIEKGTKMSVEEIQKQAVDALSHPETGLRKQLSDNFAKGLSEIQDKYNLTKFKSAQDAAQSFKDNVIAQLENRGANEAAQRIKDGFNPIDITAISQIKNKANEVLGNLANFPLVKEATDNWAKTSKQVYDFTRGSEDYINAQKALKDSIVSALRKFKVGVKGGVPDFSKSAIVKSGEQENIKQILSTVTGWKDFSPEGMQALMSRAGALSKFDTPKGSQSSAVIGEMYNNTKEKLVKKFYPELAELRTNFDKTKSVLDEIGNVIGETANKPTSRQQAISRLSNIYKTDKETYLNAVKELSNRSGVDILGMLAGTEFQRALPDFVRGIGGAGALGVSAAVLNPYALLLAPLFSPKAVKSIVSPNPAFKNVITKGSEIGKKLIEASPSITK